MDAPNSRLRCGTATLNPTWCRVLEGVVRNHPAVHEALRFTGCIAAFFAEPYLTSSFQTQLDVFASDRSDAHYPAVTIVSMVDGFFGFGFLEVLKAGGAEGGFSSQVPGLLLPWKADMKWKEPVMG